jgi:phosphatidylglycerophosphatase A
VALIVTFAAILASRADQTDKSATHDPQYIVVDEVAGMLWSTLLIPADWRWMAAAFILFRILDVLKVFPANYFDNLSETHLTPMGRGAGIVLDDVVSGFQVMVILAAASYFLIK